MAIGLEYIPQLAAARTHAARLLQHVVRSYDALYYIECPPTMLSAISLPSNSIYRRTRGASYSGGPCRIPHYAPTLRITRHLLSMAPWVSRGSFYNSNRKKNYLYWLSASWPRIFVSIRVCQLKSNSLSNN